MKATITHCKTIVLCSENDHPLEFVQDDLNPKYKYKKTILILIKAVYKNINSTEIFCDNIVKKLHHEKSKILTLIQKSNRLEVILPLSAVNLLKTKLKLIKKLIKDNFVINVYHHLKRLTKLKKNNLKSRWWNPNWKLEVNPDLLDKDDNNFVLKDEK